jgi:hypothetical protein
MGMIVVFRTGFSKRGYGECGGPVLAPFPRIGGVKEKQFISFLGIWL